jgi:hypothetical protein
VPYARSGERAMDRPGWAPPQVRPGKHTGAKSQIAAESRGFGRPAVKLGRKLGTISDEDGNFR